MWRYSHFQLPYTTSDPFPYETKLVTHVELVYALIAPFYWIWSSARMLLLVDAAFFTFSGIPVYLLARKYGLKQLLSLSILVSYLAFYGVQNAMWFDVHSASFAAALIMWFIFFLDTKRIRLSFLFLFLAITAKENIGLLTLLICCLYYIKRRDTVSLILAGFSVVYLVFIYLVYFPHIVHHHYLYQNSAGLLSNLNPISLIDTSEKREAIFYSLFSYGFLPLLLPWNLLPALGDFATYFILASDLTASHGLFMHYRITLAPLLIWPTILVLSRFKKLNTFSIGVYLILCTATTQYTLHLPLSYLTKSWFWTEPTAVKHINSLKDMLTPQDAIVAQNNIIPHISQRDKIYTLYPDTKKFISDSPCGQSECDWFRWDGNPTFLFVDTSPNWDARHLLTDRDKFSKGIQNLEKEHIIIPVKRSENAGLYRVLRNPNTIK